MLPLTIASNSLWFPTSIIFFYLLFTVWLPYFKWLFDAFYFLHSMRILLFKLIFRQTCIFITTNPSACERNLKMPTFVFAAKLFTSPVLLLSLLLLPSLFTFQLLFTNSIYWFALNLQFQLGFVFRIVRIWQLFILVY